MRAIPSRAAATGGSGLRGQRPVQAARTVAIAATAANGTPTRISIGL